MKNFAELHYYRSQKKKKMISNITRNSFERLYLYLIRRRPVFSSSALLPVNRLPSSPYHHHHPSQPNPSSSSSSFSDLFRHWVAIPSGPTSTFSSPVTLRSFSSTGSSSDQEESLRYEATEYVEPIDLWEEEDEAEPEIGDGGDGGGIVLQYCPWGERALSIAREVLLQFGDDIDLFAFKTSPRGYIYVRLDRLSNEYGCPDIEDLESYNRLYKKRLDEVGALGEIPDDLALEVSSPGADRLLKVPEDLHRFKDMPMRVSYAEDVDARFPEKDGIFILVSIDRESESCVWKLADVKENRDPSAKGRPLSRKRKDWRLNLPYSMFKRVNLYLAH